MNTRRKLILSLGALVLTVMVGIVSVVGVLSLLRADFNFGGSISFTANSVNATISTATVTNGTVTDAENKMRAITYDAYSDGSETSGTWSDVQLQFTENGDDVVIKFTVTNHSDTENLRLTIGNLVGTTNNATMSATITGEEPVIKTITIDKATPAQGETPRVEHSKEIVVTFHILDKNKDASITGFIIPIELKNADGYYVTVRFHDSYKTDVAGAANTIEIEKCYDDPNNNTRSTLNTSFREQFFMEIYDASYGISFNYIGGDYGIIINGEFYRNHTVGQTDVVYGVIDKDINIFIVNARY